MDRALEPPARGRSQDCHGAGIVGQAPAGKLAPMDAQPEPVILSVSELRVVAAKLLDAIEARFGPQIELGADHYWLIEADEAFDLSQEPAVNAGQLSDDLESVRGMANPAPAELAHDLDHLVGLLRRVSALSRS